MKTIVKTIAGVSLLAAAVAANAEIKVGGTVEPILDLEVKQEANLDNLDLSKAMSNTLIATGIVNSNIQKGYTISVKSANNCKLVSSVAGTVPILYSLNFEGKGASGFNDKCIESHLFLTTEALTGGKTIINAEHPLKMGLAAQDSAKLIAGSYTDTITMNIKAN